MHIEADLDDIYTQRLALLQQSLQNFVRGIDDVD